MSLQGKVAIVTGGARGIGAGIVRALAADGASVAFNYVSDSSRALAEMLVQDITAAGGRASCVQADVADPQSPYNIVSAALRAFDVDYIDILVNNAGVAQNTKLKDITIEEYEKQMAINVRSVIFMTQQVLPYLKRDRGGNRIINLSSISARGGFATQTVYAASKAAVEGLTRVWAKELRHECNVTVNAVNPGPVDTDSTEQLAPRCGRETDIADIVALLCTEKARWITGDVICANGGMLFV